MDALKTSTGSDGQTRSGQAPKGGFWERFPVILLMVMVLLIAGLLSAMTAMRFTIRGREVTVPDLAGMNQNEAAALLFDAGLGLDVEGRRFSDTVPEGMILDQTPPPGLRVKRARSVRVLTSLGERQFPVPDLAGDSLRSAQIRLIQRGLSVGNTMYAHTDVGEAASVVYQSPPAGDLRGTDPSVNVLISLGPIDEYYVMPDVTGRVAREVTQRIREAGFRLPEVTTVPGRAGSGGRVLRQQPPAGHRVSKNDIIRLEVSG